MEDHRRLEITGVRLTLHSPRVRAGLALLPAAMAAAVLRFSPAWIYAICPACPFRALTGWRCPGCGSTHALAAMLSGRFADAFHYNAAAVAVWPVLAALAAAEIYSALRWNRWQYSGSLSRLKPTLQGLRSSNPGGSLAGPG